MISKACCVVESQPCRHAVPQVTWLLYQIHCMTTILLISCSLSGFSHLLLWSLSCLWYIKKFCIVSDEVVYQLTTGNCAIRISKFTLSSSYVFVKYIQYDKPIFKTAVTQDRMCNINGVAQKIHFPHLCRAFYYLSVHCSGFTGLQCYLYTEGNCFHQKAVIT